MSLIEARDIRVAFKKESSRKIFGKEMQEVLRGVSLRLEEGECLGIIGESGSGKSTLGRVLAGLLRPQRGQVLLGGLDPYTRHNKEQKRHLQQYASIVFQDYSSSANPRFRVEQVLDEALRVLERAGQKIKRPRRCAELLEQVGLDSSYLRRYPHELSGGQLQRVCIARAIALNPRVILLDEAISSLDASTQIQIMDLLQALQKQNKLSYLFITHDLTSVTYMCDRVLFFQNGQVVEQVDNISRIGEIGNEYARRLLASVMGLGLNARAEEGDICLAAKKPDSQVA